MSPFEQQDAYIQLRGLIAERVSPVLVWTGSGLSAAAGLPTWSDLKSSLVEALVKKANSFTESEATKLLDIADGIRSEPNYWVAFERLQSSLGKASYREQVRAALARANQAHVPETYKNIWRLPVNGVMNLNLDRLATRAFWEVGPRVVPQEYLGSQIGRLMNILHSEHRFIANLHGTLEDSSTWVFTRRELSQLTASDQYRGFLATCLSTFTNIFIGMSVDDVAVGGHLHTLSTLGIQTPVHYWLTSRSDLKTDTWAESFNVRPIRYDSRSGNHSEVNEFFQGILNYIPREPADAPPVAATTDTARPATLPTPAELATWDANKIRLVLNAKASEILDEDGDGEYNEYNRFIATYDEAIYRGWYTTTTPGRNRILGYELQKDVARGAFGRVFKAVDQDGNQVAIKVMLEEIRSNIELLKSFRRGVRSMRILQDRHVKGMVSYLNASEIPAVVVMDWIDGPNLADAKESGFLNNWISVLKVSLALVDIIRAAHVLPERVLHRDIRPTNIMLRNFWDDPDAPEVMVLDFDLSWHRGAQERSVLHGTAPGYLGYLAPEQIERIPNASTRNAAVDAFGIGMTLYFLISGVDPQPNSHRQQGWNEKVHNEARHLPASAWKSLPARFARLVTVSTRDRQNERWDLSQVRGELGRLLEAETDPTRFSSTEFLAEELAANCTALESYDWLSDESCARCILPTGLSLEIRGDEPAGLVIFIAKWNSTGVARRKGLDKFVSAGAQTARARLKSSGWKLRIEAVESHSLQIEAEISTQLLCGRADKFGTDLDRALEKLRFSS